ncbi:DUF1818 family protein [filamentous cyanobacterium LEGE 11480]|uniref:DUF1818 family protein n=1 Tax=Romeriopsis navalis LEGE 11480 TaxID=2777977 RepID=A0A928VUR1_9CYAN|nr:DUF1818 family protein [Romeriopsis navalis]MBE9032887.1 DUF1818 family protein [Romeriopsis navalis LEGE 11480]
MSRILKSGAGWRIGWNPEALEFQGLVGTDDWAIELTQAELDDFCRLALQLSETMQLMQQELMDEEVITIEAESDCLWIEAEGFPSAYGLRFILQSGRGVEGAWLVAAVPGLLGAVRSLKVW